MLSLLRGDWVVVRWACLSNQQMEFQKDSIKVILVFRHTIWYLCDYDSSNLCHLISMSLPICSEHHMLVFHLIEKFVLLWNDMLFFFWNCTTSISIGTKMVLSHYQLVLKWRYLSTTRKSHRCKILNYPYWILLKTSTIG